MLTYNIFTLKFTKQTIRIIIKNINILLKMTKIKIIFDSIMENMLVFN